MWLAKMASRRTCPKWRLSSVDGLRKKPENVSFV